MSDQEGLGDCRLGIADWRGKRRNVEISAAPHLEGRYDALVYAEPLVELVGDWGESLSRPVEPQGVETLQAHERTGRPRGTDAFVAKLDRRLHRPLRSRIPERKPKKTNDRGKKNVWCSTLMGVQVF